MHHSPRAPVKCEASSVSGPRCIARYDYESDEAGDLSFSAGDVIRLLAMEGDDWLKGELLGRQGIFPLTFVEVVEELPRDTHSSSQDTQHESLQEKEKPEDKQPEEASSSGGGGMGEPDAHTVSPGTAGNYFLLTTIKKQKKTLSICQDC